MFALDRDVVPADRRARVVAAMLRQAPDRADGSIMIFYYLIKQLYALDQPDLDARILNWFRQGWQPMVASPWECSWESLTGGSKAHIYGMYPGYFLSAYLLGVRRDLPAWRHQIIIEPHLAGLTHAEGVVVTGFGPVPVEWKNEWRAVFHIHHSLKYRCHPVASEQTREDGNQLKWEISPGQGSGIASCFQT